MIRGQEVKPVSKISYDFVELEQHNKQLYDDFLNELSFQRRFQSLPAADNHRGIQATEELLAIEYQPIND